jgi:hypothetical protein
VPTRFGPETRFEVTPVPLAPFRIAQEARFEQLKSRLLGEKLEDLADPQLNSHVRRAANEAAALAWITAYPLLVFPGLFDEKTRATLNVSDGQPPGHPRNSVLLAA